MGWWWLWGTLVERIGRLLRGGDEKWSVGEGDIGGSVEVEVEIIYVWELVMPSWWGPCGVMTRLIRGPRID